MNPVDNENRNDNERGFLVSKPGEGMHDVARRIKEEEKKKKREEATARVDVYASDSKSKDGGANASAKEQSVNPKEEKNKDFDAKTADWYELARRAKIEKDATKAEALLKEMKARIKFANENGMIDLEISRENIIQILENNDWDHFYTELIRQGRTREAESDATRGYKSDPRYNGMVESLYESVANQISAEGLKKTKEVGGKDRQKWTNKEWEAVGKKMERDSSKNADQFKRDYEKREQYAKTDFAQLLDLDLDTLTKLVDKPVSAQKSVPETDRDSILEALQRSRPESMLRSQLLGKRIGGTIRGSSVEVMARDSSAKEGHIVPVYDIDMNDLKRTEANLNKWVDANMLAFNGDAGDSPAKSWVTHLNFYLETDLDTGFKMYKLDALHGKTGDELLAVNKKLDALAKVIEQAQSRMVAKMSVSACTRCMEESFGNGAIYSVLMVGADEKGEANLDATDVLDKYLIQNNSGYYEAVRRDPDNPLLDGYYNLLLNEMGVGTKAKKGEMRDIRFEKTDEGKYVYKESSKIFNVDIEHYKKSELYNHMGSGGDGVNGWIKSVLDKEEQDDEEVFQREKKRPFRKSREERWLALKTAADLMFVDGKFTKWRAQMEKQADQMETKSAEPLKRHIAGMSKTKNWAGDTLNAVWNPKTLPHIVKGTFQSEGGRKIMADLDKTFRPDDVIAEDSLVPVSMIGADFNSLARYYKMLGKAFGGSRAPLLADFGRDGQKSIDDVYELAHTIFGRKEFKYKELEAEYKKEEKAIEEARKNKRKYDKPLLPRMSGTEYSGMLMARFLKVKAEALTEDSAQPSVLDSTVYRLFKAPEAKYLPNAEALQFLLGQNLDGKTGFIQKMMGDRTNIQLNDIAREKLSEAIVMIRTNNQSDIWRRISEIFNILGFLMNATSTVIETTLASQGVSMGGGGKR